MKAYERFLKYVTFDTRSSETSGFHPSTESQHKLAKALADELRQIGLSDAKGDEHCYVYAHLEATNGFENLPTIALVAHIDTSPDASGANVKPEIIRYNGGDITLGNGIVLREDYYDSLKNYVGQELIVTDGNTLLGADDKAGIAEIMTAVEYLIEHREIAHGRIAVCFTPDEEIGEGTDFINLETLGADVAYTVDGGTLGEIEYENFNAANAQVVLNGVNIHPGSAKNKMRNAVLLANEFINLMPAAETPAHTEGYEGFYHINRIDGDETEASVFMLIRDHDKKNFEDRKMRLAMLTDFINRKYGEKTAELYIKDSYYNMREMIEPHIELVENAKSAFSKAGIEPNIVPIRGGTDGAKLSFMGLPCPNISTGGENYHCVQEYIPLAALDKMSEVIVNLVRAKEG